MTEKVILITGASRGIGAATAIQAAKQGWNVVISYHHRKDAATEIINQIKKCGRQALAVQTDVGSETSVLSLYTEVDKRFGRLDALVNNAGIIAPQSPLVEMSYSRLQNLFNINITGSFLCAREAIKRMAISMGGKGGAIVNLSSAAARLGSPNEFIDYAASKGAIDTLTIGLSKEVADEGIRVNAVRPGLIDTEIHADTGDPQRPEKLKPYIPMKRSGSAGEVANTILWLLSEQASYVNGALLDVAGGR